MEDNKNLNDEELELENEGTDGAEDNSDSNGNGTEDNNNDNDNVTMSKADYDKAIQSAEDKVRGKLSKKIKELEAKVNELSPVKKTEAELELEDRIAKLEEREKALQEAEAKSQFRQNLTDKGIDNSLFDFIKEDADIEALATVLSTLIKTNTVGNGYIPGDHSSDEDISFEDYMKMSYMEKEKFMNEHPVAYKRIQEQKKRK